MAEIDQKVSEYIEEIIDFTNQGCHVFSGMMYSNRVIGYLQTILEKVKRIEAKQTPLQFKTEHICPTCNAHNETIKRRMATVKKDICYCWHCGQAIEFGGEENE